MASLPENSVEHDDSVPRESRRWKRWASLAVVMLCLFAVGFAVVSPAHAQTTVTKAMETMQAIGLDEPSDLGMIAIGLLGVILGRQSGLFMGRRVGRR